MTNSRDCALNLLDLGEPVLIEVLANELLTAGAFDDAGPGKSTVVEVKLPAGNYPDSVKANLKKFLTRQSPSAKKKVVKLVR